MSPYLSTCGIGKSFGGRVVFGGVSLTAPGGSLSLLAGKNGAGKSTLLRIIARLEQPDCGRVEIGAGLRIGYIGHGTFIYSALTALENLAFHARLAQIRATPAQLMDYLDKVELRAFAREKAGTFSRGMAQRLSLARIMLADPDILLLDEPFTGLDAAYRKILTAELVERREKGAAILMVSHMLEDDIADADYVHVLNKRKLAFSGTVDQWRACRSADA